MSTRGLVGFKSKGELYCIYNQSDSYFSWLGSHVIESINKFLYEEDIELVRNNLTSIQWMNDATTSALPVSSLNIKAKDLVELVACDRTLGLVSENENIRNIFKNNETLCIFNEKDFLDDTLFCEWAYVVDLDDKTLKIRAQHEWSSFPLFSLNESEIGQALK